MSLANTTGGLFVTNSGQIGNNAILQLNIYIKRYSLKTPTFVSNKNI